MGKFLSKVFGKVIAVGTILALTAVPLMAQATAGSKLAWDQQASTLAVANALGFKYYPDGSATGVAFTGVVCTGAASPFSCSANFPAFTPGNHTLTMTASNAAGESAKSAPFTFTFVVIPATPTNLQIQ